MLRKWGEFGLRESTALSSSMFRLLNLLLISASTESCLIVYLNSVMVNRSFSVSSTLCSDDRMLKHKRCS